MSFDFSTMPLFSQSFRISFFPGGRTETVFGPAALSPIGSGRARRNGREFGGVPASGDAVAGLKRQRHGDDDEHAVSGPGQAKKRRRYAAASKGDGESTTDGEDVALAAAAACAICLEDFEAGDGLAVMPCAHRFHDGCLTEWLARSRLCPCCRHALPSEDDGSKGEAPAPPAVSSLAAAAATTSVAEGGRAAGEAATTRRRSARARQANVRLSGPEWTADISDDALGLQ